MQVCRDINECENSNGGCVENSNCINTPVSDELCCQSQNRSTVCSGSQTNLALHDHILKTVYITVFDNKKKTNTAWNTGYRFDIMLGQHTLQCLRNGFTLVSWIIILSILLVNVSLVCHGQGSFRCGHCKAGFAGDQVTGCKPERACGNGQPNPCHASAECIVHRDGQIECAVSQWSYSISHVKLMVYMV